jgi:hypothetical protein
MLDFIQLLDLSWNTDSSWVWSLLSPWRISGHARPHNRVSQLLVIISCFQMSLFGAHTLYGAASLENADSTLHPYPAHPAPHGPAAGPHWSGFLRGSWPCLCVTLPFPQPAQIQNPAPAILCFVRSSQALLPTPTNTIKPWAHLYWCSCHATWSSAWPLVLLKSTWPSARNVVGTQQALLGLINKRQPQGEGILSDYLVWFDFLAYVHHLWQIM